MAMPTKQGAVTSDPHDPTADLPAAPAAPATRTVPDEGHANAADKPFHERMGHGAADPNRGAVTNDQPARRKDD